MIKDLLALSKEAFFPVVTGGWLILVIDKIVAKSIDLVQ